MSDGPPYECHDRGETRVRWRMRDDGLEESVQFGPGFVCRDRSMKGHGIAGMQIGWYLRGPAGGAHFLLYTDWVPGRPPDKRVADMYPMGADVGYHSRRPVYEDDEPFSEDCLITGGLCYYDGSGLRAHELVYVFKEVGEQAIWDELQSVYDSLPTEVKT